jgi:hypothetical protein
MPLPFRTSCWIFILILLSKASAQTTIRSGTLQRDAQGNPIRAAAAGSDSLQHRNDLADSITISFRYFDSTRPLRLDSNVLNQHRVIMQPYDQLYLGNLGSAARPILFTPRMYAGFDAGFHAYDLYQFRLADTRFFNTTKPYSELNYILGAAAEQSIGVLFTQNFKPTYNFTFEYRFASSPGLLKNLANQDRSLRIAVPFTTKSRRYSGSAVFISNRLSAGESGGITDLAYLKDSRFNNRFLIYTRLGGDPQYNTTLFGGGSSSTGALYNNTQFYFRHQYDFGQTDSVQTDSGYVKLFYPRFRLQHNLSVSSSSYRFRDAVTYDSVRKYYGYTTLQLPLEFKDKWSEFRNEFALLLFPEKNNQNQFLKVGAAHQLLSGALDNTTLRFFNFYLLGEYRNRTRNRRWDINANGQLYVAGFHAGDYLADIRAQAFLGNNFGSVTVGFQNSNRTPGFVFDPRSSFPLLPANTNLKKENITHLYGSIEERKLGFTLSAHYYLLANYAYFDSWYHATQEATIVNVLRLGAEKKFRLGRRWNLYSELDFQQPTANAIHLPAFFTHHQLAYEGNFFRNLDLSTGLELRYFTPFKADNYSPLTGQFFWQDTTTISNRPDVAAFLHLRIKSFRLILRLENLNTISFSNGFGFTHNNFAAPYYPTPGQLLRIGIRWAFIN